MFVCMCLSFCLLSALTFAIMLQLFETDFKNTTCISHAYSTIYPQVKSIFDLDCIFLAKNIGFFVSFVYFGRVEWMFQNTILNDVDLLVYNCQIRYNLDW